MYYHYIICVTVLPTFILSGQPNIQHLLQIFSTVTYMFKSKTVEQKI